jgi:RHS repeat-associated protein
MRFTVHERDLGDTGKTADDLDNMHARSYLPFLFRFTSVDLLRGDPHSPQSFNLFAYVAGNPVNLIDPSGMGFWDWLGQLIRRIDFFFSQVFDIGYSEQITVTGQRDPVAYARVATDLTREPAPSFSPASEPSVGPQPKRQPPTKPCLNTGRHYESGHWARDYHFAAYGESIPAPEDATVVGATSMGYYVEPTGPNGTYDYSQPAPPNSANHVYLRTDVANFRVGYFHAHLIAMNGAHVSRGELFAVNDKTGRITGPHVHVTVQDESGTTIDPNEYFEGECQ